MNKVLLSTFALTIALLAQGCGGKEQGVDNPVEAVKNEAKYSELMKNWTSKDCIKSKILLVTPAHYKIEYDFYGDAFVKRYNYYSDDACTDHTARITYKGNTKIVEGNDDGLGSRYIDLQFKSVTIASVTDGGRIFLEALNFCGQTKFPAGQEVDVTATSSDADCILQSANDKTTYDRFVVSDGILRVGTGYSEKSLNDQPDERPGIQNEESFIAR